MKTVTTWTSNREFESKLAHNTILLDGNKQKGFGPKALLLSGLAGCSGIDVLDILEKMRVEINDLKMEVETTVTEDYPKVFKDILITYTVKTDPVNEEKVKKAIELSLEKYCGVSAMLQKNSPIDYKLVINS
jgi:putative redox protein